jgi:hypothetical protein
LVINDSLLAVMQLAAAEAAAAHAQHRADSSAGDAERMRAALSAQVEYRYPCLGRAAAA